MTRSPRRLPDYLGHISEAIERIQRYTDAIDESAFLNSEIIQDAVIRNFEVIGEACGNIARAGAEGGFGFGARGQVILPIGRRCHAHPLRCAPAAAARFR